jgi:hypothetical protein
MWSETLTILLSSVVVLMAFRRKIAQMASPSVIVFIVKRHQLGGLHTCSMTQSDPKE